MSASELKVMQGLRQGGILSVALFITRMDHVIKECKPKIKPLHIYIYNYNLLELQSVLTQVMLPHYQVQYNKYGERNIK